MNSLGVNFGSLWIGSLSDNGACSHIQEEELMKPENVENEIPTLVTSIGFMGQEIAIDLGKPTCRIIKWDGSSHFSEEYDTESETGCPSKFLMMCLNSIQNALQQGDGVSADADRPFFANPWGFEFWSCYTKGKDVLEMDGDDSKMEKIAWITATAADTISMKEKEGVSVNGPFLLYLVPSKEKAGKFKSSEPEFLVSTPERLLELLSLDAVDISDLSLMVIDGLDAPFEDTYLDTIKSLRQFISGNPQTVVLGTCRNDSFISACK